MIAELLIQYGLPSLGTIIASVFAARARKAACEGAAVAKSVHHEVVPNGGDSLRDAVNDIATALGGLTAVLENIDGRLSTLERRYG